MTTPPRTPSVADAPRDGEGLVVGNYRLLRVIGVGGMGSVYEAQHLTLGLRAAVKTLKPALAENTVTSTRFMREGIVAARLRHPNAVAVYDVLEERGVSYLVMEYLEGETLKELLDREQPLTPARAADLLLPVLSAVHAAHDEGIVHRDLKPSNIFLARERTGLVTPKVLDFGLSWAADEERPTGDITRSGVVLGTLLYMAPEQVKNARQASSLSDQYALGLILYQALTGHRPFLRSTQYDMMNAIVAGQHPAVRAIRPELPAALEALVERAIHVDPALRFPSTHAFARALLRFASPAVQWQWAPVFELPAPEVAAPVSSLPSVEASLPTAAPPPVAPAATDAPTPATWLSASPSRAVLLGGAACVACLALGVVIGATSSHGPAPAPPRPATTSVVAQPAQPAQPAVAPPTPGAPAVPAAVAPGAAPVVQTLRVGPAPAPAAVVDAGSGTPGYSSPRYLDRTRQAPVDPTRRAPPF